MSKTYLKAPICWFGDQNQCLCHGPGSLECGSHREVIGRAHFSYGHSLINPVLQKKGLYYTILDIDCFTVIVGAAICE